MNYYICQMFACKLLIMGGPVRQQFATRAHRNLSAASLLKCHTLSQSGSTHHQLVDMHMWITQQTGRYSHRNLSAASLLKCHTLSQSGSTHHQLVDMHMCITQQTGRYSHGNLPAASLLKYRQLSPYQLVDMHIWITQQTGMGEVISQVYDFLTKTILVLLYKAESSLLFLIVLLHMSFK